MPRLHYGSQLQLDLSPEAARRVIDAIGAHATRGGWVSITDEDGRTWSFLVSAGIPIWVAEDE